MKTQKPIRANLWTADESSGLKQDSSDSKWERFVTCRFDRNSRRNGESFNLSYFVRPGSTGPCRKAILFCAGGPGQINKHSYDSDETFATFLSFNQYDVIAFDLRGVGFSQFPPSTRFDKYLRTDLAIFDIEEIRRDWLGKDDHQKDIPWEAIIARSYGSVLAQQYAKKYPSKVKKLILLAPISRNMFEDPAFTYKSFIEEVIRINRECLMNIYDSKEEAFLAEFGDLTNEQKGVILNSIFGDSNAANKSRVFKKVDSVFGSIQYLIDDYYRLKSSGVLKDYGLGRFSRRFYSALRDLRLVGKLATKKNRDKAIEIGRILRDGVLEKSFSGAGELEKNVQLHYRVLYNMWVRDGLDPKLLECSRAVGGNTKKALGFMGGKAHVDARINRWLAKVDVDQRVKIKPWNPANYAHRVDTLILAGDADPVVCCNQAKHWYSESLSGRRILINLPGVGHDLVMPEEKDEAVLSGAIRVTGLRVDPGAVSLSRGSAKGLGFNEKLRFKVYPGKLNKSVKIVAEGILTDWKRGGDDSSPRHVIMLIRNIGSRGLSRQEVEQAQFPIECVYFSGIVEIVHSEEIPPNAARIAYGNVIKASRNPKQICKLEIDEEDLRTLPTLLGFYIDGSSVSLRFVNNSENRFQAKTINCSLSRGTLKRTFRARIPDMEAGHAQDTGPVDLVEFRVAPEEVLDVQLTPDQEEILDAEIPYEATVDAIPIIIWVKDNARAALTPRRVSFKIENVAVSLEVKVDLKDDIPPGGAAKVYADVQKLEWKNWLQIDKPADLGSDINLIGYNIIGTDRIQMFFENRGATPLRDFSRDWIYFDPRELGEPIGRTLQPLGVAGSANSLDVRKPLLNRLMFSFLVRDITEFAKETQNKVLEQVHDGFGRNGRFHVCYREG